MENNHSPILQYLKESWYMSTQGNSDLSALYWETELELKNGTKGSDYWALFM